MILIPAKMLQKAESCFFNDIGTVRLVLFYLLLTNYNIISVRSFLISSVLSLKETSPLEKVLVHQKLEDCSPETFQTALVIKRFIMYDLLLQCIFRSGQ